MMSWFLAVWITQLEFADLAAPGELGNQLGALGYAGVPIEERRDDQSLLVANTEICHLSLSPLQI
jgi:hypothetical protein